MLFYLLSVPPKIVDFSGDVTAEENDTVSLVCRVTGVPPPTVTWFRMSSDVMAHGRKERK